MAISSRGANLKEKGIAIYLSIIILSILLSTILSLSVFLIDQIRMVREMENSISAFYAADSGIEEALRIMVNNEANLQPAYGPTDIGGGAFYITNISCCNASNANCNFKAGTGESCPFGGGGGVNCSATRYCVRSVGTSDGIKRAVESSY